MSQDPKKNDLAQLTVGKEQAGRRLDSAVSALSPDAGLRGRKRLWEQYDVLVDGTPKPKGYRVRAGETIALRPKKDAESTGQRSFATPQIRILNQNNEYAALDKPAGLPTQSLAGRPGPCVEAFLNSSEPQAVLLNRLDTPTSGIVLAAMTSQAEKGYHELQEQGRVRKVYVTLVRGRMEASLTLDRSIDMAKRATVRVLDTMASPLRHTRAEPLAYIAPWRATLVRAEILRGARHQIRAHLAHAGFPILGDERYGQDEKGASLYLHHMQLVMPGFSALSLPLWPLPKT